MLSFGPTVSHPAHFALEKPLTPVQMGFINRLFSKWSLPTRLSLLELWAFDCYSELRRLISAKYSGAPPLPFKELTELLKRFSADFALGAVSQIAQGTRAGHEEDYPGFTLYERGRGSANPLCPLFTYREWSHRLNDLAAALKKLTGAAVGASQDLREQVDYLTRSLEVASELFLHPDATLFLNANDLYICGPIFPEAIRLLEGPPQKP